MLLDMIVIHCSTDGWNLVNLLHVFIDGRVFGNLTKIRLEVMMIDRIETYECSEKSNIG